MKGLPFSPCCNEAVFSRGTLILTSRHLLPYTVPDAWRLWGGPRLAYCCG